MGTVTTMEEFKRARDAKRNLSVYNKLHTEFTRAARQSQAPDFIGLSRKSHFSRENFIYEHARKLVDYVRKYYPQHDLFPAEQVAIRDIGPLIHDYCAESKGGTCAFVLRRMWDRAMEGIVDRLADTAAPIVAGPPNRNGAPDPRNA